MPIDVAATQHQLLLGYQPELEIDEPEVGLERFQPKRFDVKYSLFRVGHFTNRIVELDDKIELPNGSILHVFDNISHPDDVIDTPRVDENIFLVNESFRKFIYHVTDFNFNHIKVEERYIYRNAGIVTSLSRFRAEQGSEFKYLTDISSSDVPATSLVVVNHNPLFRVKVFGKLKYYRRINLILSSIFNTAADMASSWGDRRQYIVIPWNDEVYGKEKFLRTRYKLSPQTILQPESFQYIFMMHLVNYMWNDSTTSLFSKLSDEALSHINLVLQANDRALIFNMHTIRELNEKNRYFIKFTNQLNVLASTHHLNDESVPDEYKEKIRHALSITTDDDVDGPTQIEITESDVAVPKKQTKPATQDDNDSEVIRDNDDIAVNGMVPVTEVSPNASPISKLTKVGDFIRTAISEHSSNESEPRVQGAVAQAKAPTKTTSKPTKIVTAVDDTIITRNLELDSTMQFIDETMAATDEFIDNHENLSPKAKAKMKTIARSYQKLKLDGVPVTKILQENGSVVIDPNETKVDTDVGIVPDDRARSSTLSSFDDKYIKHTSKKHIVSTLLSFQKCGVFLTDLNTEDKVDEMNHQRTYVARFTDINSKRSTVKFTMPVVESDNRIKVDGVRQVMKKQRINLPIVKISDMEVSLATNQNKTRVIRNTTQAHSFYSKVEDIVKSEEAFDVIYGSLTINKYISYEYATIARHIRSINWLTKDKISVSLKFAYPSRHEHAEMSEEDLHELEAVYGSIYVGRYGTSKLFINVDSKLLAVTSDGKEDPEFMYDSLLDLMYNSIETKKKLNLTEWVSIKILDKMLPVIFVTAYRYGLRGALDTLGIKYTITEPRTKAIIGGTNIAAPATENIQVTSTDDAIEVIDETDAWRHDISARSPEDFGDMEWLDANDLISDIDDPTEVSDLPAMSRREAIYPSMEKFEGKTLSNTGHAALMDLIAPIRSTKYGFMFHGSRLDPEHAEDIVNEPWLSQGYLAGPKAIVKRGYSVCWDRTIYASYLLTKNRIEHICVCYQTVSKAYTSPAHSIVYAKYAGEWYEIELVTDHRWGARHICTDPKTDLYHILAITSELYHDLKDSKLYVAYGIDLSQFFDKDQIVIKDFVDYFHDEATIHSGSELHSTALANNSDNPLILLNNKKITNEMRYLFEPIGYVDTSMYDSSTNDIMKAEHMSDLKYITKNGVLLGPKQTIVQGYASAIDSAIMLASRFSSSNWKTNYYFVTTTAGDYNAIITISDKKKWYYVQPTCNCDFGPIGPFTSEDAALKCYMRRYSHYCRSNIETIVLVNVAQFFKRDRFTVQEFMDAVNESMAIGTESVTTTATGTMKYTPKSTDIAIKLADATIWFDRYPLKHSLVAAGLDEYDLRNFSLADMETKDAYYDLLTTSGMSINYLRGIDSFFDLFIDPITHNVLVSMQMPTTVIGLLYKSAEMLATLEHRNPSSRFNHRIRGYEQFNAILYNEMARQFAKYQAQRNKGNTFSINPDAVYLRIIQNASMVPSDAVNPIQDIKDKASMTYSGVGGRTAESFVIEDRKFSKDDIGVISEATVDNGKVGIVAQLSYNPALGNTLGVLNPNEVSELDPADCLSVTSLVFPFAMNDDTKRTNFINIQCTHMMPTKQVDQSRVRTGYERLLGHQVSRDYVGVASQDGIVTVVDEEAGMVEVKYKDGNRDVFRIGHTYNEFENFEVDEHLIPVVKLGQKVKKNDIICYNRGFFNYDPITGQTDFSIGIRANVALMETDQTLEDSVAISKRLSDAMTLYPIQTKYITLNRKSLVMDAKSVGEHVKVNDFLMVFDEDPIDGQEEAMSNVDATTVAMLGELSRRTPRAGYEGKIINIDAYTGCKVSEMSPSVAKLFKKAIATKQARANIAKGSVRDTEFVPSTIIPEGSKYKGVTFDKDTVVFVYRIQEALPQDKGDKMVVANQLKCTVAGVFTKPTMTAGGEEIDVIFSPCGICRRVCMSPFITGVLSKTMEKVQDEFLAIARGKK